jgi:hypothetical protein
LSHGARITTFPSCPTLPEQGAYLDGLSGVADREEGCAELVVALDKELKRSAAAA